MALGTTAPSWTMTGGTDWNSFSWFAEFLSTVAQENLYPHLFLHKWGVQTPLPSNRGVKIHVPYFEEAPSALVAALDDSVSDANLGESLSGDGFRMTMSKYEGEVKAYGGYFNFTDFFMAAEEIPDVMEAGVRQLSQRLAQQYESIILTELVAALTATVPALMVAHNASGVTTVANTDYITVDDLLRVEEKLKTQNAFTFPDGVFKTILNPKVTHDLFTDAGSAGANILMSDWLSTKEGQSKYENGMIGKLAKCEIYESTYNAPLFAGDGTIGVAGATGDALYRGWVISPGAYAVVDLQGMTPNVIIQPFGSGGTEDPLKRKMTVGIKGYFDAIQMDVGNRLVGIFGGAT